MVTPLLPLVVHRRSLAKTGLKSFDPAGISAAIRNRIAAEYRQFYRARRYSPSVSDPKKRLQQTRHERFELQGRVRRCQTNARRSGICDRGMLQVFVSQLDVPDTVSPGLIAEAALQYQGQLQAVVTVVRHGLTWRYIEQPRRTVLAC